MEIELISEQIYLTQDKPDDSTWICPEMDQEHEWSDTPRINVYPIVNLNSEDLTIMERWFCINCGLTIERKYEIPLKFEKPEIDYNPEYKIVKSYYVEGEENEIE